MAFEIINVLTYYMSGYSHNTLQRAVRVSFVMWNSIGQMYVT